MTNKLLEQPLRVAIVMLILGCQALPTVSFAAAGWDDPRFMQEKAEILMARAAGAQTQQTAISARDAAALNSAECTALETASRDAARDYVERGQPISPESIIQNTTCFLDIAQIRIPVSMTGIGFLDNIIGGLMSRLMTSACSQGMAYMNNLRTSAINQIRSGITGSLNFPQLSVAGVNVSNVVNTTVNGAVTAASTNVITNVTNAIPTGTSLLQSSGTPNSFVGF